MRLGGGIPDPTSAFAEWKKSHVEADTGVAQYSLVAKSICCKGETFSVLEAEKESQSVVEAFF